MKWLNRLFCSPYYFRELLFAGKYAAVLQLVAALFFCGLARFGGPLGSLECAEVLREAGLTTLTVALLSDFVYTVYQKTKPEV